MYYDEETKVYQDDKGIFIHRKRLDDTGKYVYAGDTPVCRFALDEQWAILVRCEIQENCFSIQLLKGQEVHHTAQAETRDTLNDFLIPWCVHAYYNQKVLEARQQYHGFFVGIEEANDGMVFFTACLIIIVIGNYFGGLVGVLIGIALAIAIMNVVGSRVIKYSEAAGYYKAKAENVARRYDLNGAKDDAQQAAVMDANPAQQAADADAAAESSAEEN